MTKHSIVVSFNQDDYLSLLEMEPDLAGLLHEIGQKIIRKELPIPPFQTAPVEPGRTKAPAFTERRLLKMYDNAYETIRLEGGEWVPWQKLRPPFRDRETYNERLWSLFVEDPDVETRAVQHGGRVRRAVRFAPLI